MAVAVLAVALALPVLAQPVVARAAETGPAGGAANATIRMTLQDAVMLAVRNNRSIQSTYLSDVLNKFDVMQDLIKFRPNLNFDGTATASGTNTYTDGQGSDVDDYSEAQGVTSKLQGEVTQKVDTGGQLTFTWAEQHNWNWDDKAGTHTTTEDGISSWTVELTQPLLKGAGVELNRASVERARLTEIERKLGLRDSVASSVLQAISYYYTYLQSYRQVEISKASLERTRQNYETNQLLIQAGRMAAVDIVQTELEIASQELDYESILNTLDQNRLALLDFLDLDKSTRVAPVEEVTLQEETPVLSRCMELARRNYTAFITARDNVRRAELTMLEAEDAQKWSLDLTGRYTEQYNGRASNTDYRQNEMYGEVAFTLPFEVYGDRYFTKKRQLVAARVGLKQSHLSLTDAEVSMSTTVQNAVRNVNSNLKQVGLAKRRTELAQRQLEIENVKLKTGRTTNFQLLSYEQSLRDAQNSEVSAIITYLNSLYSLDQILGTLLDTWSIEYKDDVERLSREYMGETVYDRYKIGREDVE
ncbi:MAG: TolC family protein [Desulfovibrionaceae bacterium]|nr:TolC family protein [Desulfovibrionaceae bacterium]